VFLIWSNLVFPITLLRNFISHVLILLMCLLGIGQDSAPYVSTGTYTEL
jgi:hypothetical protein